MNNSCFKIIMQITYVNVENVYLCLMKKLNITNITHSMIHLYLKNEFIYLCTPWCTYVKSLHLQHCWINFP